MNRVPSKQLFVAVNLPETVKDYVAALQNRARQLNLPLRFCDRNNLHLTVVFLGAVEAELLPEVESKIGAATLSGQPFEIALGTTAVLPQLPVPKYWYLAVDKLQILSRLHDSLVGSFRSIPSSLDAGREFVPHVSLGRFKRGTVDPAGLAHLLALPTRPLVFPVASLDLMASDLHFQPPHHTLLRSFPLAKSS